MKPIAILGSTGSIGRQALRVVEEHPDRLRVTALAAGSRIFIFQNEVSICLVPGKPRPLPIGGIRPRPIYPERLRIRAIHLFQTVRWICSVRILVEDIGQSQLHRLAVVRDHLGTMAD